MQCTLLGGTFAKNFNKLKFSNQAYIDSTQKQKVQNEKEIDERKRKTHNCLKRQRRKTECMLFGCAEWLSCPKADFVSTGKVHCRSHF